MFLLSVTLGGNFGLFLGMSILTIFEFVDFISRRLCAFVSKQFQEQKRNVRSAPECFTDWQVYACLSYN